MKTIEETAQAANAAYFFSTRLECEVAPADLKRLLESDPGRVFVVDIRDRKAYDAGHVPTARNIPIEELDAALPGLPRRLPVVTYCGDIACGQSLRAALELAQAGFQVRALYGGLTEWSRKGYPLEVTPPAPPVEC